MKNVSAALYKSLCFIVAFLLLCVVMNVVFRKEMFTVSVLAFSAGIGYFFLLYIASDKTEFFDEIYGYCLTAFLICIGIFQISNINNLRYAPSFDMDAIFGGAIQWLEEGSFPDYYDYYDWFPNNLGGMCVLYVFFRVGRIFTDDYFLIAAFGNEILILLTFALISLSAKKMWGSPCGILSLAICGCIPPFLFMTDVFYTDSLSMLFPVLLVFMSLKMEESKGKNIWKWCLYFGIAASIGMLIKFTVFIMVLAIGISFLVKRRWNILFKYILSVTAVFALVFFMFHACMYGKHLSQEKAEVKNTPYYHWIMMGLEGEGGYNPGDYEFTRSFSDPAIRDEALKEEIKDRISEKGLAGMIKMYRIKLVRCFGDGTLGLSDFLDDNPAKDGFLQKVLLYGGSKYSIYQGICNIIFYSLLILAFLGAITSFRQNNMLSLVMSIGGMIVFLMNWETSPRYITNYVPIIILLSVGGIRYMSDWIRESKMDKIILSFYNKYAKEIKIFGAAIGFRIVVYLFSVCVMAIFGEYADGISFSDFLETWKRWDSAHYINIAQNGYSGAIENGEHIFLVFYPLYPWILRVLSMLIYDIRYCGILASTISFAAGCIFFYKITENEFGDEAAENALLLISVFPFAFFFGSIATESLFFALSSGFFYYLRKHKWDKVAVLGMLACMTKPQGLLLTIPVIVELFYFKRGFRIIKRGNWKEFFKRIVYPGLVASTMLFGFLIYLLINYTVEGNPFRFMYYQKNHWGNSLCPIWKTIKYVKEYAVTGWYTSTGMSMWVPELILFFIYIMAIVYGICKKMRPMNMVYLITFFVLTYSSTWLLSAGRYTVNALPLFMLFGKFTAEHKKSRMPIAVLSGMMMMIYMIGFYQWKQIM